MQTSVLDKAKMFFVRGLEAVETVDAKPEGGDVDEKYLAEVELIKKSLFGNLAIVYKKMSCWTDCISNCDKVILLNHKNLVYIKQ